MCHYIYFSVTLNNKKKIEELSCDIVGLKVWHCQCSGSYGMGSILGPGTFTCHGLSQRKKNFIVNHVYNKLDSFTCLKNCF